MRILLLPFSILYGVIVFVRNKMFDWRLLKEQSFSTFIVSIGNLSAGGTGKSPHVIWLIEKLKSEFNLAVLSRGYGRSSKGFKWVLPTSGATQVGDEPLQYATLFSDITVAVCEKRVEGIQKMEREKKMQLVILDDAFQHRYVKPDFNILITDYAHLFYEDFLLPVGRLREQKSGVKRADVMIVSKSPENLSDSDIAAVSKKIQSFGVYKILFSYIRYRESMEFSDGEKMPIAYLRNCHVILVAGIANPSPFIEFVKSSAKSMAEFVFDDHHVFTSGEILKIKQSYEQSLNRLNSPIVILTTRKDWMRLNSSELKHLHQSLPIAVLDIEIGFHERSANLLLTWVKDSINSKIK
ncbi:MAG: tetraacyldisaccharide 4'-kinase [Bacteroidota bacterium]